MKNNIIITNIPEEFLDVYKVIEMGAEKHGENTWLLPDNVSLKPINNYSSCCRHNALANFGNPIDKESGLHHHLHAACRHLMAYTRFKRGIL